MHLRCALVNRRRPPPNIAGSFIQLYTKCVEDEHDLILKKWPKAPISVIMPAFNAESTIRKAALSALRSMNKESELLIYLDGCTDGTLDEVKRINDSRLRVIIGNRRLGPVAAANKLVSEAKYEHLARLDADDIALPWRLRAQVKAMISNGSDFEFTNSISFGSSLRFPFRYNFLRKSLNSEEAAKSLASKNPFVHSTAFMKRSVVMNLGGYRESAAEDYDLWLRAATSGYKLHRLRLVCLLYRVHPKQITQSASWVVALRQDELLRESRRALEEKLAGDALSK